VRCAKCSRRHPALRTAHVARRSQESKLQFSRLRHPLRHVPPGIQRGHDLLRESGVPATRTLLIGDTDHDLEVGHALGISVLLVTHGHQSAERLKRLHHDVIDVSAL